ncbi:hypothetical protein AAG570_008337 [Ranatra chinensis]|uniref:Uncharacterized protein n=1 Tax=Ranatra chinensis TaxID=642074 RepID=A0ABD0XVI6_9HEMI
MASKRRNMFYQNKKQETKEIGGGGGGGVNKMKIYSITGEMNLGRTEEINFWCSLGRRWTKPQETSGCPGVLHSRPVFQGGVGCVGERAVLQSEHSLTGKEDKTRYLKGRSQDERVLGDPWVGKTLEGPKVVLKSNSWYTYGEMRPMGSYYFSIIFLVAIYILLR